MVLRTVQGLSQLAAGALTVVTISLSVDICHSRPLWGSPYLRDSTGRGPTMEGWTYQVPIRSKVSCLNHWVVPYEKEQTWEEWEEFESLRVELEKCHLGELWLGTCGFLVVYVL